MVDTLKTRCAQAENFAVQSLRHILRHDPPRCAMSPQNPRWGLSADLERLQARVRRVGSLGALPMQLGIRGSLLVNEDEAKLLRCLARLQLGQGEPNEAVAEAHAPSFLADTLSDLAALLANAGYWLPDPTIACAPRSQNVEAAA